MHGRRDSRERKTGRFRGGFVENLEARRLLTISIAPIESTVVPALKSILIPLHGTDSAGGTINYDVTTSNDNVSAWVKPGGTFLKLSVADRGDMIFELFDDVAPTTVARITQLVSSGYYDGMALTSIRDGIVQAGDPPATPANGPDEFDASTIFTGTGLLALANSGPNTNGSQFFITAAPQRSLDFVNTIFGQLVAGRSVLDAIDAAPTDGSGRPTSPLTITSASIVQDTSDAVLVVSAPDGRGTSQILVTASNDLGDQATASFNLSFAPDTVNDRPYLDRIDDQTVIAGTSFSQWIYANDLEGDPVDYSVVQTDGGHSATIVITDGTLTVTPNPGFVGSIPLRLVATQQGAPDKTAARTFTVNVVSLTIDLNAPTVVATAASSETHTYATFTASPDGWIGDYAATVDFGDGSKADATLVPHAGGGYDVVATHAYAATGDLATRTVVTGPGGNSTAATSIAHVVAASALPIKLDVSAPPSEELTDGSVTYTVTVTNTGSTALTGLNLKVALSAGLTFSSAPTDPGSGDGSTTSIPVGDLAPGASATLKVTAYGGGFLTSSARFTVANDSTSSVEQTVVRDISTPIDFNKPPVPTGSAGGGGGRTLHWVKAPRGTNSHAITITSRTVSQMIGGRYKGWNGLSAVMARFNHNGNVPKLKAGLARIASHVPYGKNNLLPIWLRTVATTGLSKSKRDARGLVQAQLRQDLVGYLNQHVGVDINVVKSKGKHSSDKLLTFNGRL